MKINNANGKNKLELKNDMTIQSINCQEFEEFIIDFLDNKLSAVQQNIFLKHLNECPGCKRYLEDYRKSVELSQAAFDSKNASDYEAMPEELVQAILAASKKLP